MHDDGPRALFGDEVLYELPEKLKIMFQLLLVLCLLSSNYSSVSNLWITHTFDNFKLSKYQILKPP